MADEISENANPNSEILETAKSELEKITAEEPVEMQPISVVGDTELETNSRQKRK